MKYGSILILLFAAWQTSSAQAKCADPRGCLTDICNYPGNIVELTVLALSPREGLLFVQVRIDAVQIIDAGRFEQPEVGDELEITQWNGQEYFVGQRLVGLAREPGNIAWPLFGLDADGEVSCLPPRTSSKALSSEEFESVAQSGRCDRSPIPKLGECDDQGEGCATGVRGPLSICSLIFAFRWLRRKRSHPTE